MRPAAFGVGAIWNNSDDTGSKDGNIWTTVLAWYGTPDYHGIPAVRTTLRHASRSLVWGAAPINFRCPDRLPHSRNTGRLGVY